MEFHSFRRGTVPDSMFFFRIKKPGIRGQKMDVAVLKINRVKRHGNQGRL